MNSKLGLCRAMSAFRKRIAGTGESGMSLIETAISLALLGIISVGFLNALGTNSHARLVADEQVTGRILAESQMEDIKKQTYALSYNASPIPPEYSNYSAQILVNNLYNGNIQKITVTVRHQNKPVTKLECYKTNR